MTIDGEINEQQSPRRTPLFELHRQAGARFVDFAGWEMPVQYSGVNDEHFAVRRQVGIFDVSHMGEIVVSGPDAERSLQYWCSNDLSHLAEGRAQYSLLLNETGGVVDDVIVYKLTADRFFVCVNAANAQKDWQWFSAHNIFNTEIHDCSAEYAQLAVQGPLARELISRVFDQVLQSQFSEKDFRFMSFRFLPLFLEDGEEEDVLVARSGYTGEDGFEVFCSAKAAVTLWGRLLDEGRELGVRPVGLGARDTLRLEAGYPLHGHELRDDLCALSSGVAWAIKCDKPDFLGREALLAARKAGLEYQLAALEVTGKGIVRAEDQLYLGLERQGWISSGTKTPLIERPIALAYLRPGLAALGSELEAEVRGRRIAVRVVPHPFYKRTASQA